MGNIPPRCSRGMLSLCVEVRPPACGGPYVHPIGRIASRCTCVDEASGVDDALSLGLHYNILADVKRVHVEVGRPSRLVAAPVWAAVEAPYDLWE